MSNTNPIPIPFKLAWREFAARYLPVLIFVIILIAALVLWRQRLSPASILGEAETVQAIVNAPETGILSELSVRSFQQVKAGEVLGKIVGNDPRVPAVITAPIEGAVTYIHVTGGDKVRAGLPVLTVTGNKPDRIIAFLRQPIAFVPEEGTPVKIHPRARHNSTAVAVIQRVGLQLAPVRRTLLPITAASSDSAHVEYGLPVIVSVPPELKLFPGEIVDLTILPELAPKPPAKPQPAPTAPKTNAAPATVTNAPPVKK